MEYNFLGFKLSLILGAILGMVVSDAIAICFGRFLSNRVSNKFMNTLSGIIFLLFGGIGIARVFNKCAIKRIYHNKLIAYFTVTVYNSNNF